MAKRLAVVVAALLLTGCIDQSRVNDVCAWSDSVNRPLDLGRAEDREHLRADAEIANELMVRIGDAHGRHRPDLQRPYREPCMRALRDTITIRHSVTPAQLDAAERARIWWADILLVFLPIGVLAAVAMDRVVRRVCRAFEPEDRAIARASAVALTPVIALVALGVGNVWSFWVEGWRLHNGHVSNRAFFLPIVQHGWIACGVTLAICGAVAIHRWLRTPLAGVSSRYAPMHGRPLTSR